MTFNSNQIRKLQRDVKACDIRTREVNGRELSYIEGWHAIAEANRIFGFDGWSRETVESRCVLSRESRGTHHVVYVAKVRITVRADTESVIREGFGTGEAHGGTVGEAHEKAIKTAETDATKRAFATFGKPFGLALYLSTKRPNQAKEMPDIERRRTLQKIGPNGRYYVPAWKPTPIDPALQMATQQQKAEGSSPPHPTKAPANNDNEQDRPRPAIENDREELVQTKETSIAPSMVETSSTPTQHPAVLQPPMVLDYPLLIDRPKRRRNVEHLRFVAGQPCLICSRTPSDAHHLKFAQPKAMARKVSDEFTVPLCRTHHRQLHQGGDEIAWWMDLDVDPLPIAQDLWAISRSKTMPDGITKTSATEKTEEDKVKLSTVTPTATADRS